MSNFNVHHLEQLKLARPNHIPVVNQIELHPYLTRAEVVDYCQREGIVVEAYSPLTKGEKLKEPVLVNIAQKYVHVPPPPPPPPLSLSLSLSLSLCL